MPPAIRVESLSKQYRITHADGNAGYRTLREELKRLMTAPFRRGTGSTARQEVFWALRDVSFDVQPGEIVGIVGRNGAGKSTLLKILGRITRQTEGLVRLRGRIGSLLEVGTGFHSELTGRENIFLSGSILGMSRREIRSRFDEIVAFAEIETFLDTPVKRYSSGMAVRLGFAVAAHLEPEILLVDEVLAVGDMAFQKKCLGKMGDVARSGRTILFVSHNMAAVINLCERALLLDGGRLVHSGPTEDVVRQYLAAAEALAHVRLEDRQDRKGNGLLRIHAIEFGDETGRPVDAFVSGGSAVFRLHFANRAGRDLTGVTINLGINDQYGTRITMLSTQVCVTPLETIPASADKVEVLVSRLPLMPGRYSFTIFCGIGGDIADWIIDAGHFDVHEGDFFGTGKLLPPSQGSFLVDHTCRLVGATSSAD